MCEHSDIKGFNVFCFVFFSSTEPKATSCSGILTTRLQKQKVELEVCCEPRASPPDIWISSLIGGREDQVTLSPHFYVPSLLCQIALETIPLQSGAFNSHGAFYTKCEKCWLNLRVNFSSCVICMSPTIWWLDTQMVPLIKYQKCSIAMSNEAIIKWHHDLTQIIWQSFYSNPWLKSMIVWSTNQVVENDCRSPNTLDPEHNLKNGGVHSQYGGGQIGQSV